MSLVEISMDATVNTSGRRTLHPQRLGQSEHRSHDFNQERVRFCVATLSPRFAQGSFNALLAINLFPLKRFNVSNLNYVLMLIIAYVSISLEIRSYSFSLVLRCISKWNLSNSVKTDSSKSAPLASESILWSSSLARRLRRPKTGWTSSRRFPGV